MGQTDNYRNAVADCFQLGTIATNATSFTTVDTLGRGRFCTVDVIMSPATATNSSAKWTNLVISHGTTTDVTNHTALSTLTGTTNATASDSQFVIAAANLTAVRQVTRFYLDLGGMERYIGVKKQANASHHTTANTATFFRRKVAPVTDSERNVGKSVISAVA